MERFEDQVRAYINYRFPDKQKQQRLRKKLGRSTLLKTFYDVFLSKESKITLVFKEGRNFSMK